MLELSDKHFKVDIIKILQQAITSTLGTDGKVESVSKDIEDTEKDKHGNFVKKEHNN